MVIEARRAEKAAELLKALAHPVRLQIIALLTEGEEHVSGLSERLGVKQSIISQQLRILRMHRLVEVNKIQPYSYYRLTEAQLPNFVQCIEGCSLEH